MCIIYQALLSLTSPRSTHTLPIPLSISSPHPYRKQTFPCKIVSSFSARMWACEVLFSLHVDWLDHLQDLSSKPETVWFQDYRLSIIQEDIHPDFPKSLVHIVFQPLWWPLSLESVLDRFLTYGYGGEHFILFHSNLMWQKGRRREINFLSFSSPSPPPSFLNNEILKISRRILFP